MKKFMDIAEPLLNGMGILVGVSDIENILNIVLLCVSIFAILWRAGYTIYHHIKEKKFDKIGDEIDKAKDEIENLMPKEDNKHGKN